MLLDELEIESILSGCFIPTTIPNNIFDFLTGERIGKERVLFKKRRLKSLGLRKKYRLNLKNDMPPRAKIHWSVQMTDTAYPLPLNTTNAFSDTNGEDAIEHTEYFLKIVDPIDLPNVNQDKLRVVVFPISLVGDAWRCGKINTPIIKWDLTNPEFENWLASKFVNYITMDIFTNGALWEYWKLGSNEVEPTNEKTFNLEETN
uniref:Uncharacterized protein n=1 Tax=Tanacetum cinerariifolium TaxID=118510 RepID=A0A6L2LSH8_TANCI|nr:hypothetical protein [Tanacetum cinerariifolium]